VSRDRRRHGRGGSRRNYTFGGRYSGGVARLGCHRRGLEGERESHGHDERGGSRRQNQDSISFPHSPVSRNQTWIRVFAAVPSGRPCAAAGNTSSDVPRDARSNARRTERRERRKQRGKHRLRRDRAAISRPPRFTFSWNRRKEFSQFETRDSSWDPRSSSTMWYAQPSCREDRPARLQRTTHSCFPLRSTNSVRPQASSAATCACCSETTRR